MALKSNKVNAQRTSPIAEQGGAENDWIEATSTTVSTTPTEISLASTISADETETHTGATINGATVSASSINQALYDAWKAFDKDTTTRWLTPDGTTTGWLQYDFGSGNEKTISTYSIRPMDGQLTRSPNTWTLKASNTGAFGGEEVTLDAQTNIADWSEGVVKEFTFANSTSYRYYRLDITANNGDTGNLGVSEMTYKTSISSTATSLVSSSTLTQGQEVTLVKSDNSFVDGELGAVTAGGASVVLDSATKGTDVTLSGGDLTFSDTTGDSANSNVYGDTLITSGNRYWEITMTDVFAPYYGIATVNTYQTSHFANVASGYAYYPYGGTKYNNATITAYTTGDTTLDTQKVGIRYEYETGELEFYLDGISQGIAFTLPANTAVYPAFIATDNSIVTVNFGTTAFSNQPAGTTGVATISYTADITSYSLASEPSKAFVKDDTKLQLAIESTPERIVNELDTHLTVDATTDVTNLVTTEPIYEGEKLFIDDTEVTLGAVTRETSSIKNIGSNLSLYNGNLTVTSNGDAGWVNCNSYSELKMTDGNYYVEITIDLCTSTDFHIGISDNNIYQSSFVGVQSTGYAYSSLGYTYTNNNANTSYGETYTTGDIIGVRYSTITGELEFYKNGISQGIAYTLATGTEMYIGLTQRVATESATLNFGGSTFTHKPNGVDDVLTKFHSVAHGLGSTPTTAVRKGSKALTFVSSTTTEIVATSPISGLLTTGDTVLGDNNKPIVSSGVVEGTQAGAGVNIVDILGDNSCIKYYSMDGSVDTATTEGTITYDVGVFNQGAVLTSAFDLIKTGISNLGNNFTISFHAKRLNIGGFDQAWTFSTASEQIVFNLASSDMGTNFEHWVFSVNNGVGILYKDEVDYTATYTLQGSSPTNITEELRIGCGSDNSGGVDYDYNDFIIDQVRIFNRAITTEEITKVRTETSPQYTITIPAQASAPTTVAVPNRGQELTVSSKLFDGTKFNYTYGNYIKGGRAMATKVTSSASGTTVLPNIVTNLNKA